MADYIPDSESNLVSWLTNFNTQLLEHAATLSILPAETTALKDDTDDWVASYQSNLAAQNAAKLARQTKDDQKKALLAKIRALVARVQANPEINDTIRVALGITVRDTVRTTDFAAAVANARPIGKVDTSNRLQHVIDFRNAANQNKRAKPEGVRGCEIWIKVGEAPGGGPAELVGSGDPEDMRFLALDTATPYVMHFTQADTGKTAYYALRWIANDGTKGPWGETVEATIVG